MKALIGLLLFIQGVETPYKPNNEFDVKIDVQVKARPYLPGDSDPKIDFSLSKDGFPDSKRKSGYLPHLTFNVKFLKLSEGEVKVRITDASGSTVYHKKAIEGNLIRLDAGFIKDIKDGLVSGEYHIVLLSGKKRPSSRIHIFIHRDGTYYVNDVLCGKF